MKTRSNGPSSDAIVSQRRALPQLDPIRVTGSPAIASPRERRVLRRDLARHDPPALRQARRHRQRTETREGPQLEHQLRLDPVHQQLEQPALDRPAQHRRRAQRLDRRQLQARQLARRRRRAHLRVRLDLRIGDPAHDSVSPPGPPAASLVGTGPSPGSSPSSTSSIDGPARDPASPPSRRPAHPRPRHRPAPSPVSRPRPPMTPPPTAPAPPAPGRPAPGPSPGPARRTRSRRCRSPRRPA